MNGVDVYKQVIKSRDALKQFFGWAQEARDEFQSATMVRDIKDYNAELDRLIIFLNQNTSNSLVFRKNVLNIIFKNSNLYNVQILARTLRFILKQRDEIMAVLEHNYDTIDMQPHLKDKEKLKLELTTSYEKLEIFIDKLQLVLNKKEEKFDKQDEIATADLQDIREISNVSELSFDVRPKKSFLTKFLHLRKKEVPISVMPNSDVGTPNINSDVPAPASTTHRKTLQ